ncbi:MAG: FecR domain-containing protein [Rhodobacteraceae bacterium]|nr:FecR domain-containing protein [Paracoccaceae bacterium]
MPSLSRRTLLLTAAALPLARPVRADARLGEVIDVTGSGTLVRAGATLPLAPGLALMEGDMASTGEDGLALLFLNEETRINLGLSSSIELASYLSEVGGTINVGGALVFERPGTRPPVDLRFVTAFGEIGVRGTRFFVGPSRGDYAVFVDRGRVEVSNAGETRVLAAGEGCSLYEGAAPGPVSAWGEARIAEAFAGLGLSREEN